jgi:putative ABC transport system ATP-binding protein
MTTMKLEAKGINKRFADQIIISDFSISVAEGDMVAITGATGSGKTTLLHILGLIEKADSGEILYDNEVIRNFAQRRFLLQNQIGFLFQNFGLIYDETVFNNILVLKKIRRMAQKERHRRIEEAFSIVGLTRAHISKKVYECTSGEWQRIAIAKLLLKECGIIFADEPTAFLDDHNKELIMSYIKYINQTNTSVVIASHDRDVCNYCSTIIELP